MGYLSATAQAGVFDLHSNMRALQARVGLSETRQCLRMFALACSRYLVRPEEYYTYALWHQDGGRDFLPGFLSNWRTRSFNTSLKMPKRRAGGELTSDKLTTEAVFAARGLASTRTRALFTADGAPVAGLPDLTILRQTADLVGYLSDPANYPMFGKPRADSFARGAAVFQGLAGPGMVQFMNGDLAPVMALAAEIASDWGTGYLFQPFYRVAADLARQTGPAMGSVRIVTLLTDRGVEPWYAVIRLPSKTAMHDGDAQGQRIWGLIDHDTGKIIKLRDLRDPMAPDLTHGHDPEVAFLGTTLPDWPRAIALCCEAHASFPANGILGWDVFLTDQGALLNEANQNPGHVYQVAAQRPLLNPDTRPAFERARAFARLHGGGKRRF